MTDNPELKTIGFTPAIYLGNQAMFQVIGGVPIGDLGCALFGGYG